jgi:beta-mannosidase
VNCPSDWPADQQVLQWDIDDTTKDPLPARIIYERILPDVVYNLTSPIIPYWPGSPYGGEGWDTADETVGDVHQWNVWAGQERSYHDWDIMAGRFISEFGMPSLPDIRTVKYWHGDDTSERHPQSKMMQQHNKAGSHERRFAIAMNENFRYTGDLESYVPFSLFSFLFPQVEDES